MASKKWVKNIQTAGYNGARTVLKFYFCAWIIFYLKHVYLVMQICVGAVHKLRRQLGGEEVKIIGQNCWRIALKNCWHGRGGHNPEKLPITSFMNDPYKTSRQNCLWAPPGFIITKCNRARAVVYAFKLISLLSVFWYAHGSMGLNTVLSYLVLSLWKAKGQKKL